MGAGNGGPKSRGFFHIFDWNRKSRKKLFSVSPEGVKQEKRTDADLNGTKLILVDEDDAVGISSLKESSDYSCASSVTDERNGIREPGVVARLMGLESIPTSFISEPYSTPFFDIRSSSHKRSPDFFINDQFNHAQGKADVHSRKPVEFGGQKFPSSPIDRFRIETLPPRSAKPVPQIHHKLMSPIKNNGFISPQNAAHIMEAAAKILEPALTVKTKAKVSSSYGPLKVCEPKDRITPQRTPGVLELGRRTVESSDMKFLKGQSLNRSWNGSEDRSSQDISDTNSLNGMGKGKSVSLAIQAKVNVQKREALSINRKNASPVARDVDEAKLNQPFKSQQSNHKIKLHKKASLPGGSSVLRQNNQKQNCLSGKGKVNPKQSISNQQERKILYGDTSSRKIDTTNRFSGHSRVAYREETSETCFTEHEGLLSSNKNFPRKKRLTELSFNSQRNSFVDNNASKQRHVQPDVVIDEQSRWVKDNKNDGADVVSFTFTSPLVKSRPGPPSFIPAQENCDKVNICTTDSSLRKNDFTGMKSSSYGVNLITGDALSFLLDQKLKELTSGNESSYCNFVEAASTLSSIPHKQEKVSDTDSSTNTVSHEKQFMPRNSCRDKQSLTFSSGASSMNGQVFGLSYNLQGLEKAEYSSNSHAWNESFGLQPSPLSILEASLSESSNSSLNSTSTNGSKMSLHSVQAQDIISSCTPNKMPSLEAELEQSYSSSSSPSSVGSLFSSENQSNLRKSNNSDLNYVKEILNCRRMSAMDSALCPLDPLLFNKLESKRGKDGRVRRKMMFDCVNEYLNDKHSHFLRSGYQTWANGEAMMPTDMAENVYEDISRWKGFGDCMIDELVDRDMSRRRGRWVDFNTEAFELGMEMEKEIISSLIDEIFIDNYVQD